MFTLPLNVVAKMIATTNNGLMKQLFTQDIPSKIENLRDRIRYFASDGDYELQKFRYKYPLNELAGQLCPIANYHLPDIKYQNQMLHKCKEHCFSVMTFISATQIGEITYLPGIIREIDTDLTKTNHVIIY